MAEATKDSHGRYHVNGDELYRLFDSHIYEIAAALESAVYDVAQSLAHSQENA